MTAIDRMVELLRAGDVLRDPIADGRGVRVCVVDSGIERSESAGLVPVEGAIFEPNTPEPLPYQGKQSAPHGTTVADIIRRVAPGAELYSADVFGRRGTADVETIVRAVRHAINLWDCRVINLSLGVVEQKLTQFPKRQLLIRAMEEAYYQGVLVVAAAHNEHPLTRSYPAVFAPPLLSVDKGLFETPLDFAYRLTDQVEFQAHSKGYTGPFAKEPATSWAAPHLTGIAARLLSMRPGLKPFEVKTILYWLSEGSGAEE